MAHRSRDRWNTTMAAARGATTIACMTPTIIIGYDGSERASDAVALGTRLAKAFDASLILALVLRDPPLGVGQARYQAIIDDVVREERERTLEPVRERLDLPDVRAQVVAAPSPARGLHALAEREVADLIVVGSSHRGAMGRVLAGSVAERLLHGSPCAVAVAPVGYATRDGAGLAVVGVAYDGGNESRVALTQATALARTVDGSLRLIAVADPAAAHEALDAAVADLPGDVKAETVDLQGDPITCVGDQEVDLLFCGSRGYGLAGQVLLGSTSAGLVRHAPFPVVVVPRGADRPVFEHARAVERAKR